MNRQREIIYEERRMVLESQDLTQHVLEMIEDVIEGIIYRHLNPDIREEDRDPEALFVALKNKFGVSFDDLKENLHDLELLKEDILERVRKRYGEKESGLGKELMLYLVRSVFLQIIDSKWKEHLHNLDELREGIHLRAYGQSDPLVEYKREAFDMFEDMTESIKEESVEFIFKVAPAKEERIHTVFNSIEQELIHPETRGIAESISKEKASASFSNAPVDQTVPSPHRDHAEEEGVTYRRETAKVGRNDPCPCGSGKKFKKCCGA